jgi:hypothetical protein
MGKITGFLEFERQERDYEPVAERVKHWREFVLPLPEADVRKQGARDSTQKFLWRLADHSLIESVLIPASPSFYGEISDRHTLCVSTQVGCAYGCKFCASGLEGWKRHLTPNEIVEQVTAVDGGVGRNTNTKAKCKNDLPATNRQPSPRNPATDFPARAWWLMWSSWAWANRSPTLTTCSKPCACSTPDGAGAWRARSPFPPAAWPRAAAADDWNNFHLPSPCTARGRGSRPDHAGQSQVPAEGTHSGAGVLPNPAGRFVTFEPS